MGCEQRLETQLWRPCSDKTTTADLCASDNNMMTDAFSDQFAGNHALSFRFLLYMLLYDEGP
jgi:hypothetical protein